MGIFKRILSTAVSAACALTLVFGSAAVPFAYPEIKAEAVASSSEYRDKIERIVELVNEERAKDGVAPVTLNETLTDAAMLRAEEITEQFSHTRPDNTSCFTVLKDYNIGYYACAENIAAGNSTADATMNQWVNSSGHYNNLMNATYTEIGVGVVYAPDSEYGYYWVQLFIKPTNPVQTTTAVTTNTTTWATTLNTVKTTTSTSESHTSYTETTTTTTTTTTKVTTTSAWITTPETMQTYKYGDLTYGKYSAWNYVEVIDCDSSAEGTVVIPDSITVGYGYEYPVKSIRQDAFSYCKNITEVVIPDSVSTIGQDAFYNCSGLTSLNISDGVTEISSYAFYKCSGLTDVNIPESVKYIRTGAFGECSNLKSITINNPECYISGERSTISNKRYNDVETDVGYAFYGTIYGYTGSTAQKYTANKSSYTFKALDEPEVTTTAVTTSTAAWDTTVSTVKTTTSTAATSTSYTETTTTTTSRATSTSRATTSATTSTWLATSSSAEPTYRYGDLRYRINNSNGYAEIVDSDSSAEGTVVIPSAVTCYGTEYPVEKIGQYAFYYCKNITEVDIPDSVTEIGDSAFSMCTSLTDVNIPNSVTEIGDRAFSGCTSLAEVVIPDSVTEIGESAFARCTSLTEVVIPDSVTEIERWAFSMCTSLTDVNIPENVKYIRDGAFERCSNLKSITINNPECSIYDDDGTISNIRYSGMGTYFYGTIYGYTGSTAQTYAEKYGYNFVSLDEPEFTTAAVTTDITTTYTTVTTDVTETESQPPVTTTTTETSFIIITLTRATTATSIPGVMITSTSVSKSQSTGTVVTVTIPIISTVSSTVTSSDTTSASASTSATTTEIITTYLTSDLTSATSQTTSSATSSVSVIGTTVSQTTQTTPGEDIRLSRTSLDMSVGDRILLKIFGYEGTVQWVYSDPKIALVDENGYVEAVGEGSTTVYAVYGNGILSCSVTVEGTGTSETTIGDANGDGKLDVRDAAYIARMLAGGQGDEIPLTADFNGDGQVNVRDAAAIARFLANAHQ